MPKTLLIADDEEVIRRGVSKYINLHTDRLDRIYEAENGEEAIDLILKYKPDVVLLDVQMPKKNGIDVMKETDLAGVHPAFIILSGYDEFKYAQAALRYGAKEYMLKPVRASEILNCILNLLGEENSDSEEDQKLDHAMAQKAKEYIDEHFNEDLSLGDVAESIGISRGYLSTILTAHMDMGFVDYLNQVRIEHACLYLDQGSLKVYEIAYKVGFRDDKYFSKVFKKVKGVSPREYKKESSDSH